MLLELFLGNFVTLAIGGTIFILLWMLVRTPRLDGVPPGPRPLPLIGNAHHLVCGNPLENFRKLRSVYGDVFSLYLGNRLAIVINGYEALREALVKQGDVFSGRFRHTTKHDQMKAIPHVTADGIIRSDAGPTWKKNRRFTLHTLRDFGMGKNKLQQKIQEEIEHLLQEIDRHNGEPFDISHALTTSVSNVICSVVFGKRYDYNDEEFKEILGHLQEIFSTTSISSLTDIIPLMKHLPFVNTRQQNILNTLGVIYNHFERIVNQQKETFDESNMRSFIDAYIKETRAVTDLPDDYVPDHELGRIILDLFAAGTETTSTCLYWGIAYCVNDPNLQETLYSEIMNTVGTDRLPGMEDKLKMPNAEASILEILRHADIAPLAISHAVTESTLFRGYNIPKGTMILPVLDSVLKDPTIWPDPFTFNHKRFLDGNSVKNMEQFIPFGTGKRICAGEPLARMELFLFWSALMQNIEFLPAEEGQLPSLEARLGITQSPPPYKIRAVRRKK